MIAEPTFTSRRDGDKVRGYLWLGFTTDDTSPVTIDLESRLAGTTIDGVKRGES
jgi:hypothetical protein